MKIILIICGLIFVNLPVNAYESFSIGEKRILTSDILGADRPYIVGLPASYDNDTYYPRRYPVLYILDGEIHFHAASGVINHMSNPDNYGNMRIPEMIVVAISNTKGRLHDLTPNNSKLNFKGEKTDRMLTSGGGVKFLQFIEKELIPEIEKNYRTIPHRTFVGHSLGGLTVLHSFLTQPELYQNYIAIDSSLWWDHNIMSKWVADFVAEKKDVKAKIFMSVADHKTTGVFPSFVGMTVSNKFFAETLQESSSPDLKVKMQVFPGQDHSSVPLLSLYHGLTYVFKGYKPTPEILMGGAAALSAHYKDFSQDAGMIFLPPENLVDLIVKVQAELFGFTDETVRGYLELNVANYPNSAHARKQLAEYQEKKKKASSK